MKIVVGKEKKRWKRRSCGKSVKGMVSTNEEKRCP